MSKTTRYTIEGHICEHCSAKAEKAIAELDDISFARFDIVSGKAFIGTEREIDEGMLDRINETIDNIEKGCRLVPVESKQKTFFTEGQKSEVKTILASAFLLIYAYAASYIMNVYIGLESMYLQVILYAIAYLVAGGSVLKTAGKNILKGDFLDENFLMSLASLAAFALVLFPDAEPHMTEAVAVMLFYRIGELFEDIAVSKTRSSVKSMMDLSPDTALLVHGDHRHEVSAESIVAGNRLFIRKGDKIPADGTVCSSALIDTSSLTGETIPMALEAGGTVLSGSVNVGDPFEMIADKAMEESTAARIMKAMEEAADGKARTESLITRFAKIYTPIVVAAALMLAIVPSIITGNWVQWLTTGIVFLVVSCPCALVISVPLTFFAGIGAASKEHILIKNSLTVERLAKISAIGLDKSGTLTTGQAKVTKVVANAGYKEKEVLQLAALAEAHSTHPIAKAVMSAASVDLDQNVATELHEKSGRGVICNIDGKQVVFGSVILMKENNIETDIDKGLPVAVDGHVIGYIEIGDDIKDNAKQAVSEFNTLSVKPVMITGDSKKNAETVACQVGIDEIKAELLPEEKLDIASIMSEDIERTAFVGDGINDAPSLAAVGVGIAMGGIGSDAAIEAADIVIMDDDIVSVPKAICLARRTLTIAKENIIVSIGVKIAVMVLAIFGLAGMWAAVFGDVGVTIIAILNACRALKIRS